MRTSALLLLAITAAPSHAEQATVSTPDTIEQVLARPLFNDPYMCSEHAAGELPYPGDDLGQDCMITAFDEGKEPLFLRLYRTDGSENEDWYGWNRPVYSPCDCDVVGIHVNPLTNQPGKQNESRASGVVLKTSDGTMFAVAHLQGFVVEEGSRLKAGDQIGFVGNNGYARAPHVHIGAWRGKQALQLRWDQRAMRIH
ncbi:M23 family metallopeptidase [Luteimonas terricola]|uniref:M23ase beta-sheet core domain-containing protein n=1 Tax=Luteimonas terricola TaxID=645597 RepID=A0ABQ2EL55_9GAMM|nr:M23 family metallopeptidase [Luteimonas terricola]GGK15381.1 hypothetical protein GCM10011394_25610 [Luteimonas terricola]